MPIKALIMEIKDEYALAMSDDGAIIRIKTKPEMTVGVKIYVLEEDIYRKENKKLIYFSPKDFQKFAAVAAMITLCIVVALIGFVRKPIYATASFGTKLNLEMSKDGTVLKAKSEDQSIPLEQLRALEGRPFADVVGELQNLIGVGEMTLTFTNKATAEEKTIFEKKVFDALPVVEPEDIKSESAKPQKPITKPSTTEPTGSKPSAVQPSNSKPENTGNTGNGKGEPQKTIDTQDKNHNEEDEEARKEAEERAEEARKEAEEAAEKAREESEEAAEKAREEAEEAAEKARKEAEEAAEKAREEAEEAAEKAREESEEAAEKAREEAEEASEKVQEEAEEKNKQ